MGRTLPRYIPIPILYTDGLSINIDYSSNITKISKPYTAFLKTVFRAYGKTRRLHLKAKNGLM